MADQQPPGVPDGWTIVTPNSTAPATAGTWEDRGIGGKVWHPASGVTERDRVDNSVLGVPPEIAATMAIPVVRALGAAGVNASGRAVAGLKAAVTTTAPLVKYEATKTILTKMGVPESLATVAAMAVSGYKSGGSKAAVADDAATAAAPASAAPATAADALPAASVPTTALATSPMTAVTKAAATKPHLTLDEFRAAQALMKEGYAPEDVLKAIVKNKLPSSWLNLPNDAEVATAVKARNATGKWQE